MYGNIYLFFAFVFPPGFATKTAPTESAFRNAHTAPFIVGAMQKLEGWISFDGSLNIVYTLLAAFVCLLLRVFSRGKMTMAAG